MGGNSTGSKYYQERGCVRSQVTLDSDSLTKLKSMAIEQETSLMRTAQSALAWFADNFSQIPVGFPPPIDEERYFVYVPRQTHKQIKKIALAHKRTMTELMGFMLTVWAKANGEIES